MSDKLEIELDGSDLVKSAEQTASALRELKLQIAALNNTPTNKLKAELAGITTALTTVANDMQGVFTKSAKGITAAIKDAEAAARKGGKDIAKSMQEGADAAPVVKIRTTVQPVSLPGGATASFGVGGVDVAALNKARADILALPGARDPALDKLRQRSASAFTVDDFRALNGLPTRAQAKSFAAQLKAGMLEDVAGIKQIEAEIAATSQLRARSAGSFTVDDFRALNGLPSRDETKTIAALLKAQMLEDAAALKVATRNAAAASKLRARSASAFTLDDFRALNGMPSRDETKTFAALLKAQMLEEAAAVKLSAQEAAATSKLRARSATPYTIDDYRALNGLPSRAESKAFAAQLKAQLEQEVKESQAASQKRWSDIARVARVQTSQATAKPAGSFSVSEGTGLGNLVELNKASAGLKKLTGDTNELHSAVRGLASGVGAMWLTWGSVAPLAAGAAISAAIVQTVRQGAEVQESMTRLRVLGGESAGSVAGLNKQMLELSRTGPFGPKDVAEAMKTLTLAGLSAYEVSSSIRDVLNFSLAGDVGIKEAADALTTISTAFGVSAQGYGYVSDVISKAAAESKSSVEDLAGAFKTASVINQQYGVSLEETAVGLSLLANAGIKNTAAGTALRNMYADLSGRSKKVEDALKSLGVQAFDPLTGKMRETGVVFKEMLASLEAKKTPEGARRILGTIFGERGEKEAFALFAALKKAAADTGSSVGNAYDELLAKVTNAAGFAAIAAAEISLSPLNQMKSVAATLQSVLVETFDSLQPYLLETAANLKAIINSDEFRGAMQSLVVGLGQLITLVIEHGRGLATMLLAYTGIRAAVTLVGLLATGMSALTLAAEGTAVAVTAVGIAAKVATVGTPLLLALTAAVTVAAAAWAAYELWMGKASTTQSQSFTNTDQLIKALDDEAARLDKVNEARSRGITLQQLELEGHKKLAVAEGDKLIADAQAKVAASRAAVQSASANFVGSERAKAELAQKRANQLAADELALQNTLAQVDGKRRELQEAKNRVQLKSLSGQTAERDDAKARAAAAASSFKGSDSGDVVSGHAKAMKAISDNELEQIRTQYRSRMIVISEGEANAEKLLQAARSSTLINQGTFYAEELRIASKSEANKLAENERARTEYQAAYDRRIREENEQYSKSKQDNKGKKGAAEKDAEGLKALQDRLGNLGESAKTFFDQLDNEDKKIKDGAFARMTLQAIALRGEIAAAARSSSEFWRTESENREKSLRNASTEDQLRYATPENKAYLSARATEYERISDKVQEYDHTITKLMENLAAYRSELSKQGQPTKEQIQLEGLLTDQLEDQLAERDKLAGRAPQLANDAGDRAREKFGKDALKESSDNIADSLSAGIMSGFKKGQNFADAFAEELKSQFAKLILRPAIEPIAQAGAGFINFAFKSLAGALGLNSFDVGTDYVTHDQVALIHKGEKIVPAAENRRESKAAPVQQVVVHQNFTVGDVASMTQVQQAVAGAEGRISARMARSMTYGGALAQT